MFTKEERKKLMQGDVITVGSKRYALCNHCHKIVQLNKPVIGSVHVCSEIR